MEKEIVLAAIIAAAVVYYLTQQDDDNDTQTQDALDDTMTVADQAAAAVSGPTPVSGMHTSARMIDQMKRRESYQSKPYNLNDGGWTWGYGHQGTKSETPPAYISQADADALFVQDVAQRGEYWVKLYVTVPQTQNQFDALVSIALNMSPRSFKLFADDVNAGKGIDAMCATSVQWMKADPATGRKDMRAGIQDRRNAEMDVYDRGIYR